jgi:1,4-alpha-glucan branching enzyme
MSYPKILETDPYLKPFERAVIGRLNRTQKKENELLINSKNIVDFSNGHNFFGLHKIKKHWYFREWAPNAKEIFVTGTFTNWSFDEKFRFENKGEYWELKVPLELINHGDLYKLKIRWDNGHGERMPAWGRRVVQDEETKIFCAQVWEPEKKYKWKNKNFVRKDEAPLIYEAHIGMSSAEERVATYKEFTENMLPRIKNLGYNTIQLMAIQEHPYYGSFGYHVSSFFAPSSRFGTPEDLKELIDTAHGYGLTVIMDLVHSHAVKNEIEGLGLYDGTVYQFFHEGNRGNHDAWDSKCFNYAKNEVLHFLLSNCKYWIEEFDFDGYRFDGITSMLYLDHGLGRDFDSYEKYYDGAEDDDAISYLILANKLIHDLKPSAITVAEDMSGMPGLAAPLEDGGYGFNYRLSMGVPDFWIKIIKEKKDEDWNVSQIFHELTQARHDEKVISYAESHDQALVGDKTIAFRLMDKEMYFCMHVGHQNLIIERGMALHKMIRLITLATAKNGYLNFMGNEFGHPEWIDFPREGNNWSFKHARRLWFLADDKELRYHFLNQFDEDIVKAVKNNASFFNNYCYKLYENIEKQILIFERSGYFFFFNFSPFNSYTDVELDFPQGEYKVLLTVDSSKYGGHLRVDENYIYTTIPESEAYFAKHKLKIYLPSQSATVLINKKDDVNQ